MRGGTSQALQTIAALRAFGFLESQKAGSGVQLMLTDDARTYLRAQQESVKREVVRRAAIRPKQIEAYWMDWGSDRPPDPVCLDQLVLRGGFTPDGASNFLKVYDATIAYVDPAESDKIPADRVDESVPPAKEDPAVSHHRATSQPQRPTPPPRERDEVRMMEGERVVFTEEGQPSQYLKLIASGEVDAGMLEALEDL